MGGGRGRGYAECQHPGRGQANRVREKHERGPVLRRPRSHPRPRKSEQSVCVFVLHLKPFFPFIDIQKHSESLLISSSWRDTTSLCGHSLRDRVWEIEIPDTSYNLCTIFSCSVQCIVTFCACIRENNCVGPGSDDNCSSPGSGSFKGRGWLNRGFCNDATATFAFFGTKLKYERIFILAYIRQSPDISHILLLLFSLLSESIQ